MSSSRQAILGATLGATAAVSLFGAVAVSGSELGPRGQRVAAHIDQPMPSPVTGDRLFAPVSISHGARSKACMTADDVLAMLALDVESVGGDIILMTNGAQQDFSNAWRGMVGGRRVEVSLVLVHLIPDPGGEAIVDVVEIGGHGCAVSRTLLAAADWLELMELARSVEV